MEFSNDHTMVRPLCSSHGASNENVTASHYDVVDQMPVFEAGMHPRCFIFVILLEVYLLWSGHAWESKKSRAVCIDLTNTMSTKHSTPYLVVQAYLDIEVAKLGIWQSASSRD